MSLDSITETIAHFIGTFQLTMEQAILRQQYEEFTALRRLAEVEGLEDPIRIVVKADLDLKPKDYDPLPYRFPEPPADPQLPLPPAGPMLESSIQIGDPLAPGGFVPQSELPISVGPQFLMLQPQVVSDLIGSAVAYTFQTLVLRDNDTVGAGDFRDAAMLTAQAEAALDVAHSLHAMAVPSLAIPDYMTPEYLDTLVEQITTPMNGSVQGVTVHQFQGEDAEGIIVNGQHVSEAPVWSDLLPAYHQPEEAEENLVSQSYPAEWNQSEGPESHEGHTVVNGGNLAINEVALNVGWVDAPFIAVGGQAISLTMISQVALVSDVDVGNTGSGAGTNVVQSAQIETEANPAPWLAGTSAVAGGAGQPSFLTVDWIHGDLVVANFLKQVINATDIDHIQTEISASSTMYAMGGNQMVNVADIVQLGNYYDLIMIGGDMISVDMLFQTLVLMDDDLVSGGLAGPAGGANENLLMNQASVMTNGLDLQEALEENMAEAMTLNEMNMAALEDALLNDPMFAGMEQMRVLKIDGNLLQVNIIEQVTMLADQDDIFLSGPHGASTEVVAGSNAMLNAANINKLGVDSVVMAGQGAYSELLLHQASLIDLPENEIGPEFANEAIAILMEEAMTAGQAVSGPTAPALTPEDLDANVGMQSILT
ncbi:type I secretion protein [Ruegeria arenilitoris]|uniref:type I secretion protein n=1 Tax=Ruegeria arenilitoris TaxID=1173585 RepID=UPI00147B9E7C|nr:type I secretion protein [Ruegeria arenilitoris]